MPTLMCRNCGNVTNSAVADYLKNPTINLKEGKADKCYAKFVGSYYERGCAYDELTKHDFMKGFVDRLIAMYKDLRG